MLNKFDTKYYRYEILKVQLFRGKKKLNRKYEPYKQKCFKRKEKKNKTNRKGEPNLTATFVASWWCCNLLLSLVLVDRARRSDRYLSQCTNILTTMLYSTKDKKKKKPRILSLLQQDTESKTKLFRDVHFELWTTMNFQPFCKGA